MSEMIERVAKALYLHASKHAREEFPGPDDGWDSLLSEAGRNGWRETAKIAIKATRELPDEPGPRYAAGEYSRRTQEAMVDDAIRAERE